MAVTPKFTGLLALCLCATAAIASPLPAGPNVGSLDVHTPAAPLSDRRADTPAANAPALSSLGADNLGAASFLGARGVVKVEPLMEDSVNTNNGHDKREPKKDTVLGAEAPAGVDSMLHNYEDGKRAPKQDQIIGVEAPLRLGTASYHRYSDRKRDMGSPPPPPPPAGWTIPSLDPSIDALRVHMRQTGPPPPPPKEYSLPNPDLSTDILNIAVRQYPPPPPPQGMTIPATKGNVQVAHVST